MVGLGIRGDRVLRITASNLSNIFAYVWRKPHGAHSTQRAPCCCYNGAEFGQCCESNCQACLCLQQVGFSVAAIGIAIHGCVVNPLWRNALWYLKIFRWEKIFITLGVVMKRTTSLCVLLVLAQVAHADVYVLESDGLAAKHPTQAVPSQQVAGTLFNAHTAKSGEKRDGIPLGGVHPNASGSQALIDASGLKYFINTNMTYSTSSSASGAMSGANYTHAVAATTMSGGVNNAILTNAFNGYGAICVNLTGALGTCKTSNPNDVSYNKNGPATNECNGRQIVFPAQTIAAPAPLGVTAPIAGVLSVSRKIYVPTDDTFSRSLNIVTNISAAPVTFSLMTSNDLGSGNSTMITGTSTGTIPPTVADKWVTSFQAYSGTTSSEPRLGHVLQGVTAATPVAAINFADGSGFPWWGYTVTLNPGQTKIIMNFVTGQASNAAAKATAARLMTLPPTSLACMTPTEKAQVSNFVAAVPPPSQIPSLSPLALIWLMLGVVLVAAGFYTLRRRV